MAVAFSSTPITNARVGNTQVNRMYAGSTLVWQQRPVVTSASLTITIGVPFSYQISATNSPHTSYGATGLPAGLSVNTSTGLISGTPTSEGTSSVTISATNTGGTGTATLTLTVVGQVPGITSPLTATATVEVPFSYQITASGSPTSFNATGLPAGLSVNTSTGVISGTPTTQGTSSVTISATNTGGTGTATLSLTVQAALPGAPVITSPLTATATVEVPFSYTITATNSPTSFNATGLPAGLSVNTSTGVISGTPTTSGTSSISVSATNTGGTGTATLSLTVQTALPGAPVVTLPSDIPAVIGRVFFLYVTATNSPTSFAATGLPSGMTINTSDGLISGTPPTLGTTAITVSATNATGTGSKTINLTVYPQPVITSTLSVPVPFYRIAPQDHSPTFDPVNNFTSVGFAHKITHDSPIPLVLEAGSTANYTSFKEDLLISGKYTNVYFYTFSPTYSIPFSLCLPQIPGTPEFVNRVADGPLDIVSQSSYSGDGVGRPEYGYPDLLPVVFRNYSQPFWWSPVESLPAGTYEAMLANASNSGINISQQRGQIIAPFDETWRGKTVSYRVKRWDFGSGVWQEGSWSNWVSSTPEPGGLWFNTNFGNFIFSRLQIQVQLPTSILYPPEFNSVSSTCAGYLDGVYSFQSITFPGVPQGSLVPGAKIKLTASSSLGLPINFRSTNPSAASVTGGLLIVHQQQTFAVVAYQPGTCVDFSGPRPQGYSSATQLFTF